MLSLYFAEGFYYRDTGTVQISSNMTYLSPHVHRIVCEITEEGNAGCLKGDGGEICTANSDDLTVDGDEASKKKTFYLMYAKKLWHAPVNCHLNGSNQSEIIRAVKYTEWTGCAERILEWMKMPTEFTNLIILKLTVIIERSLGDIFVTITNKRCPSLLKDLLQTDALRRVFGEHLMTAFETLMGPPVSLNLRNVLWHGFPMLGEINSQYRTLLLDHIITSGKVLEEKQIGNIKHRPSLSIPNTDLIKDCFPSMNGREIVFKICKSTAFIPTGMVPAWKIALELFLSERYSDAVIIFLPQLEHALRCLFTIINCCPHRQITAESDVLYTTFDEILAKDIESHTPNILLPEIGSNIVEMLYDLLYFPEGFRLRDRLSHGEYNFDDVNDFVIANHVICIGLCLCIKYLFPWRQHLKVESKVLGELVKSMNSYRSVYHPIPFLMREIGFALDKNEAVICEIETTVEVDAARTETEKIEKLKCTFKNICIRVIRVIDRQTPCTEIDGNDGFDHQSVVEMIRNLINMKREVIHRPKSELEITGILRKITKQVHTASDQILCSTSEKRIQLENRTLRSRARNNYMNMLAVIPVLTSCWLSLLLIASIETLIFDGTNSPQVVKHLKKCLKYSENITTFCSPQHNKWLECLLASEKLSEILEDRLKLITTENFIA